MQSKRKCRSYIRQAKKIKELQELLPVSSFVVQFYLDVNEYLQPLLSIIDEEWQTQIKGSAKDAVGCPTNDHYALAFEQYVKEATDRLSAHIKEPDLLNQVPSTLHPLLYSIPAKFRLVLLDYTNTTFGLPVLTRTLLVFLASHFKRIPLALQEVGSILAIELDTNDRQSKQVSHWLDPLVDYQVSFSKSPNSPYTQTGIDAIKCYDWLAKDCPADELVRFMFLKQIS